MGQINLFSLENYSLKKVLKNFKNNFKRNITHSTRSSTYLKLAMLVQDRSDLAQGERDGLIRVFNIQLRSNAEKKIIKNFSTGFSFIEVTLTIAIIGMMITALFSLQFGAFRNVTVEHAVLSRIFYIRNIYFDPENFQKLQKDKTLTQEIADPKMKMVSKYSEVAEKSEIAKKFENMYLVKSTGSWQGMQTEQQETLVSFVYVKPKEKEEKKIK